MRFSRCVQPWPHTHPRHLRYGDYWTVVGFHTKVSLLPPLSNSTCYFKALSRATVAPALSLPLETRGGKCCTLPTSRNLIAAHCLCHEMSCSFQFWSEILEKTTGRITQQDTTLDRQSRQNLMQMPPTFNGGTCRCRQWMRLAGSQQ